MILASLLLAAGAPGPQTSYLVDGERTHEWSQFDDSEKGKAWIDLDWRETITHEGVEFPTVLIRFQPKEGAGPFSLGEFQLAIDCQGKRMAIADGWGDEGPDGMVFQRPKGPPVFDFAEAPFDATEEYLFRHVCGPEWTP